MKILNSKGDSFCFIYAVATLVGVMVGAGIFGLPFIAFKSGFWITVFYLLVLGLVMTLVHLTFGEVILRTRERHRLPGYVRFYLGKRASFVAVMVDMVGGFGSMLVYILLGGQFMKLIFGNLVAVPVGGFVVIFWALVSFAVIQGLRTVERWELWLNVFLILALVFIFFVGLGKFEAANFQSLNWANFFLPYGVVLFALGGMSAIPELRDILKLQTPFFKKAIIWGMLIPVVLSIIFIAAVLGVSGSETTPDALTGLKNFLGSGIILPVAVFGLASLASSYLVVGLYMKDMFHMDLGVKDRLSGFLVIGVPILAYVLGFTNFIDILGFVGAVAGGVAYIVLMMIYRAAQTKGDRLPEYKLSLSPILVYAIAIIFAVGTIYYLYSYF
jgi:tyrosine-specific transport protein